MLDMTKYINDCPYPHKPHKDDEDYNNFKKAKAIFDQRQKELYDKFVVDALIDLEILDHPKASQAFDIAFQERYISSGFSGVYILLSEIALLLK
jgi:hypothetical protein